MIYHIHKYDVYDGRNLPTGQSFPTFYLYLYHPYFYTNRYINHVTP